MLRLISPLLSLALIAATTSAALAQADAQQAYQQAKTAYQAGNFAEARDLAQTASETDAKNPEVFLLLGKAHYQLGQIDEAMEAWKRTLALAPQEPFAQQMLLVLRGQITDADTRLKLIEAMMRERPSNVELWAAALLACRNLMTDKGLTDPQRAKTMTLQADLLVRMGKHSDAQKVLHELVLLYPNQADPVQTTLLLGQAKLHMGGESAAEGLSLLKKVVAEHADTPAAATARFELIKFDLKQGVDPQRADAVAKWIAESPTHPQVVEALQALIEANLAVTRQGVKPTADSQLSKWDVDALALTVRLYQQMPEADYTPTLLKHFEEHYAANGAHGAVVKATETLLAGSPPRKSRLSVLKALGSSKYQIAVKWLADQAREGKLPHGVARGKLPQVLAGVVNVYETIRTEYPAEPFWVEQAALAVGVRTYSSKVLPTTRFQGLKGPDAWAVDIAMPVVVANGDVAAVQTAVAEVVQQVVNDCSKIDSPVARKTAVDLSAALLAGVAPTHSAWSGVTAAHSGLLDSYAQYLFNENVNAGDDQQNAELSDPQKQLLATLAKHVAREVEQAPAALQRLTKHLQPWVQHGHWAVAEEAYATLAKALPKAERRLADLAVVNLWISQVTRQHTRLTTLGLTVPRELDPTLKKALKRCYELQAGLDAKSAELKPIRDVSDAIVAHYKVLEYYEVAEAVVQVKAQQAVDAADEYAEFQLVRLKDEHARRELTRLLEQYGAAEKIALGPEFQEAIAGWKKFITDRPTSMLVAQASAAITSIGRLFEQQGAHLEAAGVYGDLAQFAAAVKLLSQSPPGTSSAAQRAAFARANALDAQARKLLAKQAADRKSDDPPPAKLGEQFAEAISAYKTFMADHEQSPLVGNAITKIMAVAYEYAKIDAWDVADSVYADLLASKLSIRRPERLEFCRGLCQLGKAMPDHAREVLSVLTSSGLRGSAEESSETMLAVSGRLRTLGGAGFGGGMGGMGGMGVTFDGGAVTGPADATATPPPTTRPEPASPSDESQTSAEADRDSQLLAVIRRQESSRAAQVSQLRARFANRNLAVAQLEVQAGNQVAQQPEQGQQQVVQQDLQQPVPTVPVLSEAELQRQETALNAAYAILQNIRKNHPHTPTAEQARGEILVIVGHWRSLSQWERSAVLAVKFITDNATDRELPKLRLEVARDRMAWASKPLERKAGKQEMMAEVSQRFDAARKELEKIVTDFSNERKYQQDAQWDIANSFLTQARVVGAFSPVLARGQYVRTTRELRQVADKYPGHPQIGTIPQMLWNISAELESRGYDDESILVWNELTIYDPMHALSQQAALKVAQTYHQKLKRPLRAAEAYQELNFARGGNDQTLQNSIFQIGSELKGQQRWVEALHVLETFVDSFPKHAQSGQALTMVGQIHQANEAWEDAIAAYRRVIMEFENGQFVQQAKWEIAECTINLSQWRKASDAYRGYVQAYSKDAKVAEANHRVEVLKDLVRYQGLVDEEDQRKAFDAQYQIAVIVANQLANPVKAIIEYRKVATNWSDSHLADDALYAVGTTYLSLGDTEKAREALLAVAEEYPTSPLADDALLAIGKSYEDEAGTLTTVTRETTLARNKDIAQKKAYQLSQMNRSRQAEFKNQRIVDLKAAGKGKLAEVEAASVASNFGQFNDANVMLFAQKAEQEVEMLTATQLADRQDKINAALRKAVEAYTKASKVAAADKADDALLQMATIYDQQLKDSQAAMQTWLEIVRQFSGTDVAQNASWRIAETYQRQGKYAEAIEAYKAFLRNYRSSGQAGAAQFAIAENYEHLGEWVNSMDSYTNYINNFPEGPQVAKAKEQISWIKTYRL